LAGLPGRGIGYPETGINVQRIEVRYFLEVDVRLKDNVGQTFQRSVSNTFSREVTMEGEVLGGSFNSLYWFVVGTALTFLNVPVGMLGGPPPAPQVLFQGALLIDSLTVTEDRNGWGRLSVKASSNPYLY
jgi:hypothetical protein